MSEIILTFPSDSSHLNILKIGAYKINPGNDPIYKNLYDNLNVIFVEPVERYIRSLQDYYNNALPNNKFIYINKAVYKNESKIKIFFPSITNDWNKVPLWLEQCSSIRPTHIQDHGYDIDIDTAIVPTTTINSIIQTHSIKSIDYLVVDAEGADYDILTTYDFAVKPKYLSFENLHMDGYKTKGEKYKTLVEYLVYKGYEIILEDSMDTHLKLK